MSEYLLGLLLRRPSLWRAVGNGLAASALAIILLALQIGRRLDRIENTSSRVGVALDVHLEQVLPLWLSPFIPETVVGFVSWGSIGIFGFVLAVTSKKIARLDH